MKIDRCQFCGSDLGLYSKEIARYDQYYTYKGEPDGYSDISNIVRRKTTPLYCVHCDKRVTTLEKLERHDEASETCQDYGPKED